ncbi:MAG: hypothetical protein MUP98_20720 [Candidatus Aminicenantes bacterium]|nr:hypothetical protein [Candidatus Aminicenantes bacterium]
MKETFRWNPYADQPHNVAPKKERLRHHFKHAGSYFSLLFSNLRKLAPGLKLYKKYRKFQYKEKVLIADPFAVAVSPRENRNEEIVALLEEMGVKKTLVRIASWEMGQFERIEALLVLLKDKGIDVIFALLQQRDDVLSPEKWQAFLEEVFSRFRKFSSYFEIGHAWNRTKWGVWDYTEYLCLAERAVPLAKSYNVKLVGPAVIDFEFHLYPPVLKKIPFNIASSLLYVDRMGAPESKQSGWDTSKKLALLRATLDVCRKEMPLWITEFNWPLKETGKYSPASGKPNVTEEEQADYLVRYYVLCLATGFVERIYWWQLVAPGYGLIDSREEQWRKRPSFFAFKTMVSFLRDSEFQGIISHPIAEIFVFHRQGKKFVVVWTKDTSNEGKFLALDDFLLGRTVRVVGRDGEDLPVSGGQLKIDGSPKYVYYKEK